MPTDARAVVLAPDAYPLVAARFASDTPNAAMLESLLEGRTPGEILVDRADAPTHALAVMGYHRIAFASVNAPPEFLSRAIEGRAPVLLATTEPVHGDALPRIELARLAEHPPPARPLPPGCALRPMDAALMDACRWRHEAVAACGSVERFLSVGFGLVITEGDAIVAEGYACFIGGGRAELGVTTHPDHRGRGLAVIVCAALLDRCAARGLAPTWSCNADHAASLAVARAIGFEGARPYAFVTLKERLPATQPERVTDALAV
ncbi:MAG: GNAT family N-acetyltransferase [Polyangiales bacterium]